METITPINTLQEIHNKLVDLSVLFRARVCDECNWSVPTYYRKMRYDTRSHPTDRKRMVPILSNAEKEKIVAITDEILAALWTGIEQHRKK